MKMLRYIINDFVTSRYIPHTLFFFPFLYSPSLKKNILCKVKLFVKIIYKMIHKGLQVDLEYKVAKNLQIEISFLKKKYEIILL